MVSKPLVQLPKLRARKHQDKQARRQAILDATLSMWEQVAYPDFTMSTLATHLGLAKGTLYLYFPTKEELFLTVFEGLLGEWFDHLGEELSRGTSSAAKLAKLFASSLAQRPQLARLFPLLESILEHNITPEKTHAYKSWLLQQAAPIAGFLEHHLDLQPGQGIKALAYTQALVSGLQQMTDLAPTVRQALQEPALSVLKMEFEPDLEASLEALYSGMSTKEKR